MSDGLARRCPTERDTIALGWRIGERLSSGDLVSLHGELGAGKTVLVRGIAAGAGADARVVRSPTFVFHHVYRGGRVLLHHLDLYRLGPGADVTFLDIDGLLQGGAVVVEWGDLADLSRFAPIDVSVDVDADNARVISRGAAGSAAIAGAWAPVPAQT
jgi:tRNA threonylcarbamoyladenosine biosynthesis protein TsaE